MKNRDMEIGREYAIGAWRKERSKSGLTIFFSPLYVTPFVRYGRRSWFKRHLLGIFGGQGALRRFIEGRNGKIVSVSL